MQLTERITKEMKEALKEHDTVRLSVLRGLMSAFTNENVSNKRKPDTPLSDEEALQVIARQAKQRKDSIAQFKAGGRDDLAEKEQAELHLLEAYLPEMLSQEEIMPIAEKKQQELGITDAAEKGKLMGVLMQELKGKADGTDVKAVVDKLLS